MSTQGRRMISGMERTPSGAISRSKTNIAKRAEKLRQANRESALRESRVGIALQEKTQLTRARVHGLTPAQAASQHSASIEGRLHLRGVITKTELLAVEHYNLVVARYGRAIGLPKNSNNPLARYVASDARPITAEPSGASVALAKARFDDAAKAIATAGPKAAWAISCVCRTGAELPDNFRPAFAQGAKALVAHFRLGHDPDRNATAA